MAFLNPVVVEGARIVLRQATQTALTTTSSLTSSAPSATSSLPTTSVFSSSAAASTTDNSSLSNGSGSGGSGSNNNNNNNNNGQGSSSSLLFFVALGFGVVFTNLWIIVGVKYCFRYNARNRALRNEDGEPINMENMPRPHRRRREKKLMPIDEVNEKFPMMKYKTWVASRAQEGLPTRGGVSAPPSRPNSIRDVDGVVPELPSKERSSLEERPTTSATGTAAAAAATTAGDPAAEPATDVDAIAGRETPEKPEVQSPQHVPKESTSSTLGGLARISTDSHREAQTTVAQKHMSQLSHDEDDEDEHIDAALPPECVGTSGDTCAICIDTLENDDDVRGLTCGHAFHAVCIDPWLTTRRACCPLCKADYYTPKPRPQPAEGTEGATGAAAANLTDANANTRTNQPSRPRHAFLGFGRLDRRSRNQQGSDRQRASGGTGAGDDANPSIIGRVMSRTSSNPAPSPRGPASYPGSGGFFSNMRSALPSFPLNRSRRQTGPEASGANALPVTTPSQLEAGMTTTAN